MKITKLNYADIKSLSKIGRQIISTTDYYSNSAKKAEIKKFNLSELEKDLKNNKKLFLLAKDKEKIVGFCFGHLDCGTFWLDWIGVLPEHRKNKIGTALIKSIETGAQKLGAHKIWCDSLENNKESINLLSKCDFKKMTLIKKHWYKQNFYLWQKFI